MSTWLIPRDELTPDQLRAIELGPNEHRVIFGAPGSGMTQILLYRARYLLDFWKVRPENFKIFVYNKVLKQYIRSALSLLNLPDNCVMTFDSWCIDFYRKYIGGPLPKIQGKKDPDFIEIRQKVWEKLRESQPDQTSLPGERSARNTSDVPSYDLFWWMKDRISTAPPLKFSAP